MAPLGLIDIVRAMGAGETVVVAAVLGIVILYLFRGKRIARSVVGLVGTAWLLAVAIGVAVIVLVGWVDLRPEAFISDVSAWAGAVWQAITGSVGEWLQTISGGFV